MTITGLALANSTLKMFNYYLGVLGYVSLFNRYPSPPRLR